MNAINKIITAITFIVVATAANAQTKFTINYDPETVTNNAVLNKIGGNDNELKFEKNASGTFIKWQTANESNTSHFELQISYDNNTFETIKRVAASDVTVWNTNYQIKFSKTYISEEKVYYRVKTVFTNGAEFYTSSSAFAVSIGNQVSYASIH